MSITTLPVLLVVAGQSAPALLQLFGRRGFAAMEVGDMGALHAHIRAHGMPDVVIVDFEHAESDTAVLFLANSEPRPVLVGIANADGFMTGEESLDAGFLRPVDPARLYTRVVSLLAERKKGPGAKRNRLTGVVAVVKGNALFHLAVRELSKAVPPLNAPAILEKALLELGAHPESLSRVDLAAMLASGRLAEALASFGDPTQVRAALANLEGLVES